MIDNLSSTPHFISKRFWYDDGSGEVRQALTDALSVPDRWDFIVPKKYWDTQTGCGLNVRTHEYEIVGEKELGEAARARDM
jgi:hypothetical protein